MKEDDYDCCDESEDFDKVVGSTNEEDSHSYAAQQEGVPKSGGLKNFQRELYAQYDKSKPGGQQASVFASSVKSAKNSNFEDKGAICSIPRVEALKTEGDGNCFFHAAFGKEGQEGYRANKAQEMREEWSEFLSKFESFNDPNMPKVLRECLCSVFHLFKDEDEGIKAIQDLSLQEEIIDHGENLFLGNSAFYKSYLRTIEKQNYHIFLEEASLLASLANTKIHIYVKGENIVYEQVLEPKPEMVKGYVPNERLWGKNRKVAIFHQGNHYSRLPNEILELLQCNIVTSERRDGFPFKRVENTPQENEQGGASHSKSPGKESTPPIGQSSVSPKKSSTGGGNRGLDVSRGEQVSPKVSGVKAPMNWRLYFDESGSANLGSDNNSGVVESSPESNRTSQSAKGAFRMGQDPCEMREDSTSLEKLNARVLLETTSRNFFLADGKEVELSGFLKTSRDKRFESNAARLKFLNLNIDLSGDQRRVLLRLFFFAEFWDTAPSSSTNAFRNVLWSQVCSAKIESDVFETYVDHVANFVVSTTAIDCLERILQRAKSVSQRVVLNLVVKICEKIFSIFGKYNRGEFMDSTKVVKYLSDLDELCKRDRKNKIADIQLSDYSNYEEICSLLGKRPSDTRSMIDFFKRKIETTKKIENESFSDFINFLLEQNWKELEKFSPCEKKEFLKECNYYLITLAIDEITVDEVTVDDEKCLKSVSSMAKDCLDQEEKIAMLKRACEYVVSQRNGFVEGVAFNSTKVFSLLCESLNHTESKFVEETILKMCVIGSRTDDRQFCENVLPVAVSSREGNTSVNSSGKTIKEFFRQYKFDRLRIISKIEKKGDHFEVTQLQLIRISNRNEGHHVIPVSTFLRCIKKFFIGKDFFEAVKDLYFIFSKAKEKRFRYWSSIEKSFEELRKSHLGTTKLQQSIQSKLTLEELEKVSEEFEILQKLRLKDFLENELIPFAFFAWDERLTSVYYQHRTSQELGAEGKVVESVNKLFTKLLEEKCPDLSHFKKRVKKIQDEFFNAMDLPLHIRLGFPSEESDRTHLSQYLIRSFKIIKKYLGSMIEYELSEKIKIEKYSTLNSRKVEILEKILELNKQSSDKKYRKKCREIESNCEHEDILKYFDEFKIKREFECKIREFKKFNECSGQYLEIVEKFFQGKKIGNDFSMLKKELTYVLKILSLLQNPGNGDFSTIEGFIDKMAKDDLAHIIYDARKLFQAWVYIMELAQGHSYRGTSNYIDYLNSFFSKKSFVLALIGHWKEKNSSDLVKRLEELSKDILEDKDDKLESSFDYDVQSDNVMPSSDNLSSGTGNSNIDQADYSIISGNISNDIKNHTVIYNLIEKNLKEGCSIFDKTFLDVAVKHVAGKECQIFVVQNEAEFFQSIKVNESKIAKYEEGFKQLNIVIFKNAKDRKLRQNVFKKFIEYKNGMLIRLKERRCGPYVITLEHELSDNDSRINTLTDDRSSVNAMLYYIGSRLSPIFDHSSILGHDRYESSPEIEIEVPSSGEYNKFPSYVGEYYNGVIGQVLKGGVEQNTAVFECDALLKKPLVCLYAEHLIQEGSHNKGKVQKLFLNTPDYVDHWEKIKEISGCGWCLKNQIDGESKSSDSNDVQLPYIKFEPFSSEPSSSFQGISYCEKVAKGTRTSTDKACIKTELLDPMEIT
ncbi:hypothetical protein HCR15_02260 [Wolbachia pipientis]|uniref:hypothetical protein n=1 Tax=Wolbachia pipientis TaxID=955 RepID=UPI0015F85F36|nr:hypothetical protein [Wolbachia pipientis]MBA8755952.1 hypothetical protein [Wolbachia pipientis]